MPQDRLNVVLDESRWSKIRDFQAKFGKENTSDAVRAMIDVAHREQSSPLLAQWKEQVVNWAGLLSVLAIMSIAGGLVTPSFQLESGILMAGLLVMAAIALVSAVELANRANGKYDFMSLLWRIRQ